jgi:hypothetical protein
MFCSGLDLALSVDSAIGAEFRKSRPMYSTEAEFMNVQLF